MTLQIHDPSEDFGMASASMGLVNVPRRGGLYRNFGKRALDISAVVLTGIVVVPLILLLALAVALDGSSPFYWNDRVGRDRTSGFISRAGLSGTFGREGPMSGPCRRVLSEAPPAVRQRRTPTRYGPAPRRAAGR